ncbi:MAG: hypothetical protein HYV26_07910 [Candidatus Hydrogenedentes bacterium]|nr:hypothetical protein [Candidatus Hydrogenedentota bacterium]
MFRGYPGLRIVKFGLIMVVINMHASALNDQPLGQQPPAEGGAELNQGQTAVENIASEVVTYHGFSYAAALRAKSETSPRVVEDLKKALQDREEIKNWGDYAKLLAVADNRDETIEYLLTYIRRQEDWNAGKLSPLLVAFKLNALEAMGFMSNPKALEVIRESLTPEGARVLVSAWINDPNLHWHWARNRLGIVTYAQQCAARGLVLARDPAGTAAVEAIYRELDREIRGNETYVDASALSAEMDAKSRLYSGVITALAMRDMIADLGMAEYLHAEVDGNFFNTFGKYSDKYDALIPMMEAVRSPDGQSPQN